MIGHSTGKKQNVGTHFSQISSKSSNNITHTKRFRTEKPEKNELSNKLIKQVNNENQRIENYFKKKSNSVDELPDNIVVPVNQSHDNIFTKKLDILIEQEFENDIDFD